LPSEQHASDRVEVAQANLAQPGSDEDVKAVSIGAVSAPPTNDPLPSLPPTAVRILAATQTLLAESGFSGLTLDAIAKKSGENSAMVRYYFGNKDGLIDAVIASIVHDDSLHVAGVMRDVTGEDRLPKFVDGLQTLSLSQSFRVFFDLLPYSLRHEKFKEHMGRVYDWYRAIKLEWLRADDDDRTLDREALLGFADLMVAVVDGLAIQHALDDQFDLDRPYRVLEWILRRCLPDLLTDEAVGGPAGAERPPLT
jgi:AcrR family transcriptional regulator